MTATYPAALKANMKITNKFAPRIRAGIGVQTSDLLRKLALRTLPRGPPGEGEPRTKIKSF